MSTSGNDDRDEEYRRRRERMVAEQLAERDIKSPRILEAFLKVPRHEFVPPERLSQAYADHPVSIACGQTISQPYIVALMTEALELDGTRKVLEIGTGSGYQTAILSLLAAEVYTVERIPDLADEAGNRLDRLGFSNIHYRTADGTLGWDEYAPYDAILAAAAGPSVPESLKSQLGEGGRLVMPVGGAYSQMLTVVTRRGEGFDTEKTCPCIFVKLIGREGYDEP